MSASAVNAFTPQYKREIHHIFQQMDSKLAGSVMLERTTEASTHNFHRLAAVAANTRANGSSADVTGLNPTSSVVTATLVNFEAPIYHSKFDELKTNADLRRGYQKSAVAAINRARDDQIITAMDLATTTLTTTAGGLTSAKLAEALEFFNANDVPFEERIAVWSPSAVADAYVLERLTSRDYADLDRIRAEGKGTVFGFNVVMSSRLPLSVANRTVFYFHKSAVAQAVGMDPVVEVNYVAEKVSWLINAMLSSGSVIVDNAGIVKQTIAE